MRTKTTRDPALKDEKELLQTEAKVGSTLYFYNRGLKRVMAKEVDAEPYAARPEDVPQKLRQFLKQ